MQLLQSAKGLPPGASCTNSNAQCILFRRLTNNSGELHRNSHTCRVEQLLRNSAPADVCGKWITCVELRTWPCVCATLLIRRPRKNTEYGCAVFEVAVHEWVDVNLLQVERVALDLHVSAAQQLTSFKSQNGGVCGETKARVKAQPKTTKAPIRARLVVWMLSVGLEPRRFGSKSIKRLLCIFRAFSCGQDGCCADKSKCANRQWQGRKKLAPDVWFGRPRKVCQPKRDSM